ncbi:unnamed protein product, partial [Rotaria magnacalcarata]
MNKNSKKLINHPIQINARSRIDTWRDEIDKPIASVSKSIDQPVHVQAHSKIDTWGTQIQSNTDHNHRMTNNPVYVNVQSKIDTWSTVREGRIGKKKHIFNRLINVVARSKIDSWQNIKESIRQSSAPIVGQQRLHVVARSRLDTWQSNSRKQSIPSTRSQLVHKPVHVQAQPKVNTWNDNNVTVKRKEIFRDKQQFIYVDTRPKIDTWLEPPSKNTDLHRSNSILNQPIDPLHIEPSLNACNDQYKTSQNTVDIFNRPIHVEAHSKVNTFQSQQSLPKHKQNAL